MTTISFEVANKGKTAVAFIPLVDSISLTELATEYERNHHWQPAGGYGGLIPSYYNYGPIDSYLLGDAHGAGFDDSERIALLGCECGEVGCWPLLAEVKAEDQLVIWTDFKQPHRPKRDYSSFGPFSFGRVQYEQALADLQKNL